MDTDSYIRMTDSAIMVEWINNVGDYCGPGDMGLVVYLEFSRGLHCYLSREADEVGLSITGALTLGGWVWFDTQSRGQQTAIMGKWYADTDNRAYTLYKKSNGDIAFDISEKGVNSINEVTDGGENYSVGEWKFIVGRFTPSSEIALFINGKWYKETAGIFSAIYDCTEPFEIARYDRSNYFDGKLCHLFVSANAVEDDEIELLYAHTRAMFLGTRAGSPVTPSGINERVTNTALMIEYQADNLLHVTNSALMIEYAISPDIRVTNEAVMVERHSTTPEIRVTNDAVMVERRLTAPEIRVTNDAVMVERVPSQADIRITNYAIMVERSSSTSSSSSSSSSSSTTSSSTSIP